MRLLAAASLVLVLALPCPASADDFDTANFAHPTVIDNPWQSLQPGMRFVYRGTTIDGSERVGHRLVSTVTDLTKVIDGIRTVVVWDEDFSAGALVETEIAFFAQDDAGNVWELGEHPEAYENGKIVESPTWIHGIDHARAGISMKAAPRADTPSYSLGLGPAVGFTDRARVLNVGQKTCIPSRCFTGVLLVDEFNPDQPGKHQLKYYAPGVGNVRVGWSGAREDSKETLVLVGLERIGPRALDRARAAALKLERSAYRITASVYGHTQPAEAAPVHRRSLGWARLASRSSTRGAVQPTFAAAAARIVITARVTSPPSFARGTKIEVVRPDGRIARTAWFGRVGKGEALRLVLPHSSFADNPGVWHARFIVQRSVRSAIAFTVGQG
ncbi:MAG: hypothetical protein QOD65_2227 [Gaiellales bacterium]|jgi:hypothetical protein|nr:hypothetical protein [Gaiellales bacterium]